MSASIQLANPEPFQSLFMGLALLATIVIAKAFTLWIPRGSDIVKPSKEALLTAQGAFLFGGSRNSELQ